MALRYKPIPTNIASSGREQQTNFPPSSKNNYRSIFKKKSPLIHQAIEQDDEEPISSEQLAELNRDIEDTPVKGTDDRKTKRRKLKKVLHKVRDDFLMRAEKYDIYQETFQGRNSFSKTDTDATFMRMKEEEKSEYEEWSAQARL